MSRARRPAILLRPWRRFRRAVLARRRILAAVLAGLAVLVAVRANAAPPPPTSTVLTAARDLPAGAVLAADDVAPVEFAPDTVPAGLLPRSAAAVGRTTTGPIRVGEALTDARFVAPDLLDGYPGRVAAPVRIGDADTVRLLRVGDRISLIAADPQGEVAPVEVAAAVPVIAIPRSRSGSSSDLTVGALVVVAVLPDTARDLAGHAVASFLTAVIVR
jgi:Flp pilus assembly protein CpaB